MGAAVPVKKLRIRKSRADYRGLHTGMILVDYESSLAGNSRTRMRACRWPVLFLLLFLLAAGPAVAGSVEVGLANDKEFDAWLCGGPMPAKSHASSACGNAKFKECSSCEALVISNNSKDYVTVDTEIQGRGFRDARSVSFGMGMFAVCKPGPGRKGGSASNSCANLTPGSNCIFNIEFCPEHSGTTKAQLKVILGTDQKRKWRPSHWWARLTTARLSRPTRSACAPRRADGNTKVHGVYLEQVDGKILIDVQVKRTTRKAKPQRR